MLGQRNANQARCRVRLQAVRNIWKIGPVPTQHQDVGAKRRKLKGFSSEEGTSACMSGHLEVKGVHDEPEKVAHLQRSCGDNASGINWFVF